MAFLSALGYLAIVALLAMVALAYGASILRRLGLETPSVLERCLYSAGITFALIQVAVHGLVAVGWMRGGLVPLFIVMAIAAGKGWKILRDLASALISFRAQLKHSRLATGLVTLIAVLLVSDAFVAMAPLTGSDALHYHFTAPSLWLQHGFHPLYDITLSFAVGQSHMLILLGLALGSDHISLGLIFLGGVLSAAALYRFAREWMSLEGSLAATLTFLFTPMIFWQMTVAGAPDIWMLFYSTIAVMAAARGISGRSARWAIIAGFLAGAAGGSKYPAMIIPIAICALLIIETLSIRIAFVSAFSALAAGVWHLLRNAMWTGDPVFPFLSRWLAKSDFNPYTFSSVLADTRPAASHSGILSWIEYPFRLTLEGANFGVGHYFGPLVLVFAPLLVFAFKSTPLFRAGAGVWAAVFITNVFTSQMARFLLPVFAIALVFVFAGIEKIMKNGRPVLRFACAGSIVVFLLFGAASYAFYARDFLPAGLGIEPRDHFLLRLAPNYQEAAFVNATLEGKPGAAMVFFRHVYYLRVNHMDGDPQSNWLMDPDKLAPPDSMLAFLRKSGVRWVVKTGDYPNAIRDPLQTLELTGDLRPVASTVANDFAGWRVEGVRINVPVQILEVKQQEP
ncbi:MAG TPA: DUF1420 family protein [Candidatus Acidoferrum sp.]|nr:DUF1420 family protein [Candidatus Acidoferrum sp.]